jgi:transcriptional regulator with XRE-family HTH domain
MGAFVERLGARIKRLRLERGLSVNTLAGATKVKRQTLYNIEAGRAAPSIDHLSRLARALKCEELDLLLLPDVHARHAVAELLRGRPASMALTVMAAAEKIVAVEPGTPPRRRDR